MTEPTGRSFLSYRRVRQDEAALLIAAQHDHGIPTWQDVQNLDSVPTEDEVRRVIADPTIASAVLFVTPEVDTSPIIRNVEVPKIVQRAEANDGFFVVPLAAGGLDYTQAAGITSNCLSAQNLADWNMHKVGAANLSPNDAAAIAHRVLVLRIQAIHRHVPAGEHLQLALFVRRPPPFQCGVALSLDWSSRFADKQASPETWRDILLPALTRIADAIRHHAPGRQVEGSGIPTLPAAAALGCAFSSTSGLPLSWRQFTPDQTDQLWSITSKRERSGFEPHITSKDPNARDIAVLVSVADNAEPLFAAYQRKLPLLRALVHVTKASSYPHLLSTPGQAADVAFVVHEGLRTVRREYGNVGTVHLFMAVPAGLAVLIGQLLNTFGSVQTYEHVTLDGSGTYVPAALLRPNN